MNTNLLKGSIISRGFSVKQVAENLGISEATFYRKMNGESDFYCDEILRICQFLGVKDPIPIFFSELITETQKN